MDYKWLWAILCGGLLGAAFYFDQPVKQILFLHEFHLSGSGVFRSTMPAKIIKAIGEFPTVAVLVLVLMSLARLKWRHAVIILLCAATSILSEAFKFIVGRSRPVADDGSLTAHLDIIPLAVRATGNAFPSGHSMLAFATAVCIAEYYPRYAWACYAIATIVAAERVLEVSHHISDVVAGAILAVIIARFCIKMTQKWADRAPSQLPIPEESLVTT